jgi:RNA polymerase sigma factor (sigma-70 family)
MDDGLLLRNYATSRDAAAFAELVRRYAGMVYGTCLRITRNAHDAEDAAQESFLEFARRAGSVQQAGPWLHGVAANKARNAVRDAATRNRHEEMAMPEPREEPTWQDLCPQVDQAIEELPGELRDAVVQHFLRGQTQAQVAEALGVDQSTVSRRLEQAIGQLRDHLRRAGVAVSVAALGALLTQNASAAAPATLTAALGKIALAGVGKAGVAAVGPIAGVLGTAGGKLAATAVVVATVVAAGVVVSRHAAKPPPRPIVNSTTTNSANGGMDVNQKKSQLDYSKMDLKGRDWHDDSFSIVMREVARLYGRETDYATIFALSGNAFSPSWVTDKEFCRATGRMFGKEKNIDLVARFLGLSARKLAFPEPPPMPEPDAQGRTWGTPPFNDWVRNRNAQCAAVIRKELKTGETVVTSGGWRNHEWFVWGVITEARSDGTIIGETLSSPLDGNIGHCFMDHIRDYWVITPVSERLPQKDADLAMLRRVVQSLRGLHPYEPGWVVHGIAAMDLWMAQMSKPSFQEDDPASSAGNAGVNANVSTHGAEVASEYLRRRMDSFPEQMRPSIEVAAKRYAHIAELLRPFAVPPKGGQGYGAIMGDLAKQKAHAANVLVPVRAELAAAADELEKALAPTSARSEQIDLGHGAVLDLVSVPIGKFAMGARKGEPAWRDNQGPQHEVTISRAFWMGKHPVTRKQFAAFVAETNYRTVAETEGWAYGVGEKGWDKLNGATWAKPGFEQTEVHPVTCVCMRDAEAFCAWLSKKTGRNVHLPSEAQWEYACRGGSATVYPWGDTIEDAAGNLNAEDGGDGFTECHVPLPKRGTPPPPNAWKDGFIYTSPVGSFRPNAFGLYDMLGNVWEPVSDRNAPYPGGPVADPSGPATGGGRIWRGGTWDCPTAQCKPSWRQVDDSVNGRSWDTGFRVAVDLAPDR